MLTFICSASCDGGPSSWDPHSEPGLPHHPHLWGLWRTCTKHCLAERWLSYRSVKYRTPSDVSVLLVCFYSCCCFFVVLFLCLESSLQWNWSMRGNRLELGPLQLSHAGTYTCIAKNSEGQTQKDYSLTIYGKTALIIYLCIKYSQSCFLIHTVCDM